MLEEIFIDDLDDLFSVMDVGVEDSDVDVIESFVVLCGDRFLFEKGVEVRRV